MEFWKSEGDKFKEVESTKRKARKLAVRWRNTDTMHFQMFFTILKQVKA